MKTKKCVWLLAAVFCLGVLGTSAAQAAQSVLEVIPDDALGFAVINRIGQTDAKIKELGELVEAKGMYHDGHPVVGSYPTAEANALWNYILIAVEDGSLGVHNPTYTKALLEASIAALKE